MARRLLTQEEFDSIKTLAQAKAVLREFVRQTKGRKPIGDAPLGNTEYVRRYRASKRERESGLVSSGMMSDTGQVIMTAAPRKG